MKKLFGLPVLFIVLLLSTYLALAKNIDPKEISKNIAQSYLDNSLIDENWQTTNPYIASEYVYYTEKNTASYIEYKVSCDKNPNCGWIVINIDGDDVSIPIASTYGSTNYEILNTKLDAKLEMKKIRDKGKLRKAYYFSPFEQYISDENNEVEGFKFGPDIDFSFKDLEKKIQEVKTMKQSDIFKKNKKDLENQGLTSFSQKPLFGILKTYAAVTTIPDTFVPGSSTTMCGSRIPCYKFDSTFSYTGGICKFGCVPTAIAMIYAYHDRQGTYPNLLTGGLAKDYIDDATTDLAVTGMINSIRNTVGTFCNGGEGSTPAGNAQLGKAYAISKGYTNSTSSFQTGSTLLLLNSIKPEINAGRPVLVGIQNSTSGHAVVAYGYSSDTSSRMIRVNYGGGRNHTIQINPSPANQTPSYNADINVDAVSLGNPLNLGTIKSITRFKVAQ